MVQRKFTRRRQKGGGWFDWFTGKKIPVVQVTGVAPETAPPIGGRKSRKRKHKKL